MKKNILFAIADDASHFGCYGHSFVRTPCIDSLAKDGFIFNNAFTCNPKCAPSRASILTGKYSWQLDAAMNHYCTFQAGEKFIPDYLEESGYFVGVTGKGWGPGNFEKNYSRNPAGPFYNNCNDAGKEGTAINTCNYFENFKEFLSDCGEKPFYFWFGCWEPHRPYIWHEGTGKLQDVNNIPSYLPDNPIVRQDFLDYANEIEWFDLQLGKMVDYLKEIGEYDNTMIIVTSDNGCPFPRVKGQMYEQDFRLPLVVKCPDSMERGVEKQEIINFVDYLPTILEYAGIQSPSLSGHSFYPLLCEKEYIPNEYAFFGREKQDNGRENDVGYPVRCIRSQKYLLCYNFEPDRYPAGNPETGFTNCDGSPTKDEILRLKECGEDKYYNFAFGKRPQIELYDIQKDEECIDNLADEEEYQKIKIDLLHKLFEYLIQTRDPRIVQNKDYFDQIPLLTDGSYYSWQAYTEGRWKKQMF